MQADLQIVSVSGTNMVTLRSIHPSTEASGATNVSLNASYALAADPATPANDPVNGTINVHYDNIAPVALIPPAADGPPCTSLSCETRSNPQ